MSWKTLSMCGALVVVSVACGPGTSTPTGPTCSGTTPSCPAGTAPSCGAITCMGTMAVCPDGRTPSCRTIVTEVTHTYVVSVADIPDVTPEGEAVGFNLDTETDDPATPEREDIDDGTGPECTDDADFTSPVTGEVGVDNQLAAYVIGLLGGMLGPGGVEGALLEQIAAGTFLLMMDVTSNGLADDESVSVHLYLGAPDPATPCDNAAMMCPTGSICPTSATAMMPGVCGPVTGDPVAPQTTGMIVAGQSFSQMTDLATVTGFINAGRLSVEAPMLPLTLLIDGNTIALTLRQAHIGGELSSDGMTLSNGEIGAQVQVSDIIDLAGTLGLMIDEATVRSVAHPDLDMDSMMVCQAISAGLSYEAVGANP